MVHVLMMQTGLPCDVLIRSYVTRGGVVHRLRPGVFWFNRPWLLLPVIKYLVCAINNRLQCLFQLFNLCSAAQSSAKQNHSHRGMPCRWQNASRAPVDSKG